MWLEEIINFQPKNPEYLGLKIILSCAMITVPLSVI
jgi:hypothetical protein